MSWITVDTKLGNHPKMAALPSDTARYGWILTLLEAKEQRTPGTFASTQHYRHVMPRHGRFLPDYIKVGLFDVGEDGTLHVHDWKRHQWAGAKGQQRETSVGHSEDIFETSEGQKEDASRAVSVPVYVSVESSTEGVQGEPSLDPQPDAWEAFNRRTGEVPGQKMRDWLNELSEAHGESRVVEMIGRLAKTERTSVDYLKTVRDRLRADDFEAERAERQAEKAAVKAKRTPLKVVEATDVSPEEARRLAAEYHAASRQPA